MPTATRTGMTQDAINELIAKCVDEALKAYDAARNPETEAKFENEQQDDHVEGDVNNGNSNGNGNGNPNVNNGGVVPVIRECTYQDFVKCQPFNFKGTEGVMVPKEEDKVEKYIGDLPDNIQGNVIAAEPIRLEDAIHVANNLMDQKLKGYAIKNAENKRRFDSNSRDNRGQQQQPFKRHNVNGHNVVRDYTVMNNVERKRYAGVLPYCNKCRMHHKGPCMVRWGNCKKVGHMTRDCRIAVAATPQRAPARNQMGNTCHESNKAKARAYAIGGGGAGPDSNVITGLLGYPFDIDLMPIELGSFVVIVGMDWLAKYHAVIIFDERIVCIPYGDEVLIIEGDGCNGGSKSKLSIISCTKTQKYIQKGFQVYLAQVTTKKSDDEPGEKRLKDVPVVRDFPEVFPEDLPRLPPTRQVEF
ncbi:hypothetical protein Tco_1144917 [Tanacetum coccineum]